MQERNAPQIYGKVQSNEKVYCIGVEETNCFFAGGILVHNCQDSTPLQHQLMRRWGKAMDFFIIAGDDDQCLYSFMGADPRTLVGDDFPEDRKLFLRQSFRVPRVVQAYAQGIITRVGRRQQKDYRPRDEEGQVVFRLPASWKRPGNLMSFIEQDIEAGMSVMLLAPCSYALGPAVEEAKRRAIPFHNPYRTARADWNPLAVSKKRSSPLSRVLDFIQPKHELRIDTGAVSRVWSAKQLLAWTPLMDVKKMFARGFNAQLKRIAESGEGDSAEGILDLLWEFAADKDYISRIIRTVSVGTNEEMIGILQANIWEGSKNATATTEYAIRCLEKHKGDGREIKPQLCVGTIHSVKGAQADSVYVIVDTPANAYARTQHSRLEYDASVRLAYVAATRAKMKLSVLAPETRFTVRGFYS